MKNSQCARIRATAMTLLALILTGCSGGGPAVGTVVGTVTLDGQPLEEAMVRFQPENGRASIGETDENGRYELRYTANQLGAVPGNHEVTITTARPQSGGEGDQPLVEAREELLPPKYHSSSELTATVEPGHNEIDFPLSSE